MGERRRRTAPALSPFVAASPPVTAADRRRVAQRLRPQRHAPYNADFHDKPHRSECLTTKDAPP
jgi:hypothetical protein